MVLTRLLRMLKLFFQSYFFFTKNTRRFPHREDKVFIEKVHQKVSFLLTSQLFHQNIFNLIHFLLASRHTPDYILS